MMRYTHVQTTRTIRNGDSVWSTRILQDGRYDKRWMEQQDSLRLAELSICFVTIRAETQMLVVDGRRVPRVDLDWETRKVLSEQTSTIDGIAGWYCSDRNDSMSLTRWASLLSASSSSLKNSRSMSTWASRGTSYIICERLFSGWHQVSLDVSLLLNQQHHVLASCSYSFVSDWKARGRETTTVLV